MLDERACAIWLRALMHSCNATYTTALDRAERGAIAASLSSAGGFVVAEGEWQASPD